MWQRPPTVLPVLTLTQTASAVSGTLASPAPWSGAAQRMRAGSLSIATGEGQWRFGLALVKESFAL